MPYNLLNEADFKKLRQSEPKRFEAEVKGGEYLNLQGLALSLVEGVNLKILERLAKVMRAFIFAAVEAGQSGHPGGSSSKTEQFLALALSGLLPFDWLNPKNPGRDRVVWSAGHCTPALYGGLSLIYECLRRGGRQFSPAVVKAVFPQDLIRFRRVDGPAGHAESYYPFCDVSTGPSGHGLSAAAGLALLHKSCGLNTRVWTLMGDAETEEGMSYEARNLAATNNLNNLVVSLDYNHYGIDGPIEEVNSSPYLNHWLGLGWNVIEVNGHNLLELIYAYRLAAQGFENSKPTVVLAHTFKGKDYGSKENTAASHGTPIAHEEYVKILKNLGFNAPGKANEVMADIETVLETLSEEEINYVVKATEEGAAQIKPEAKLAQQIKKALKDRPMVNPAAVGRPKNLPPELVFKEGDKVSTRKATEGWFKWLMKETAFFYVGAGDLSKSILTGAAEEVYGLISAKNPLGRGIRFGIAEQNMAMLAAALTQDVLPGGFKPMSAFGTYAVFTSMMSNCVRLALIGNHLKPDSQGFFIMLAAHDGPETGEDGPTHQGLFWMSLFTAYPGIKVYKPFDASETVEMLFYALKKGEPIALSLTRPNTPVLERKWGSSAQEATQGAYVYYQSSQFSVPSSQKKKICLVISGVQVLLNTLEILPELEKDYAVKIVNVTSPQLFEQLRQEDPKMAEKIFSAEDRTCAIILHNGWKGFLYPFLLPQDYSSRSLGIDKYLKSGNVKEVYELAELTPQDIKEKILKAASGDVSRTAIYSNVTM